MALEGKGMFIWKVPRIEGGNPQAVAAVAKGAGFTHVLVKIANGNQVYHGTWNDLTDYTTPLVEALRAQGIKVWGWHYVYGDDPVGEANVAIRRVNQYRLDGYVIDAEVEYKKDGRRTAAKTFMSRLRASLPNLDIALSSFRFPNWHPQLPWTEFLSGCTYNMPQVYWMKANNPAEQLNRCVREFQKITPFRPIIPTGAAFSEMGWKPTSEEVLDFMKTAKELNLPAVNFWEWYDARAGLMPNVWEVIRDYSWTGSQPTKDICERFITLLNNHDPNTLLDLYAPSAVHITAVRAIQGLESIRGWYNTLFRQVLPKATFTLTGFSGNGSKRNMTWTATSPGGSVHNGSDTFGLYRDGKINYHYSFFTVS
jgi:hypothetical protein